MTIDDLDALLEALAEADSNRVVGIGLIQYYRDRATAAS